MKLQITLILSALLVTTSVSGATMQNQAANSSDTPEGLKVVRAVSPEVPAGLITPDHPEWVIIEFLVCADGNVKEARIVETDIERLKPYILKAFRQWKFQPKLEDGECVPARVRMPLRLVLDV